MGDIPVIDMWTPFVPSREIIECAAENFPEPQLGYLRVFWKREVTLDQVPELVRALAVDDDEILRAMDAAGVRHALVTGFNEESTGGSRFVSNDAVAAIAERHPGRFIPFAGVDVLAGADALQELEYWVRERNFRGLSLRPFMVDRPASDHVYYPFYERCVDLDIPVSIHASANWTTSRVSDLGHPRHFDRVACDFPDLKLILSHAGYPWVLEACLLAWKHPNVYLELAAHRPRYFAVPGTGWEPLLRFGATTIRDKVLWGSGAFLLGLAWRELVEEMTALPLDREVLAAWLGGNAARLLGLEWPTAG